MITFEEAVHIMSHLLTLKEGGFIEDVVEFKWEKGGTPHYKIILKSPPEDIEIEIETSS